MIGPRRLHIALRLKSGRGPRLPSAPGLLRRARRAVAFVIPAGARVFCFLSTFRRSPRRRHRSRLLTGALLSCRRPRALDGRMGRPSRVAHLPPQVYIFPSLVRLASIAEDARRPSFLPAPRGREGPNWDLFIGADFFGRAATRVSPECWRWLAGEFVRLVIGNAAVRRKPGGFAPGEAADARRRFSSYFV